MNHALLIQTAKRWRIPREVAEAALARDHQCVYCRRPFEDLDGRKSGWPSWEHIVNDIAIATEENIVLCCLGCNASKGVKSLNKWLESKYCSERGISARSMAPVAQKCLAKLVSQKPKQLQTPQ
jgi:hypothetical protein